MADRLGDVRGPADLRDLRNERGGYQFFPREYDRLPVGTFLVEEGRLHPALSARRLVRPRDPLKGAYMDYLTPGNALLYIFYGPAAQSSEPIARRALQKFDAGAVQSLRRRPFRWVIQPGEEGYELLAAFKVACDHRVGKTVNTALLSRALGLT